MRHPTLCAIFSIGIGVGLNGAAFAGQTPQPCAEETFVVPDNFKFLVGNWEGENHSITPEGTNGKSYRFTEEYASSGALWSKTGQVVYESGETRDHELKGFFDCEGNLYMRLTSGVLVQGYASSNRIVMKSDKTELRGAENLTLLDQNTVISSAMILEGNTLSQMKYGVMKRTSSPSQIAIQEIAVEEPEVCNQSDFSAPKMIATYTGKWSGPFWFADATNQNINLANDAFGLIQVQGADYSIDYTFDLEDGETLTYSNTGHFGCDGKLWFSNPIGLYGISWEKENTIFQHRIKPAVEGQITFDMIHLIEPDLALRMTQRTLNGKLVEVLFLLQNQVVGEVE